LLLAFYCSFGLALATRVRIPVVKVSVVIDHICEADILVGVFSTRQKAKRFIKEHKNDPYSPHVNARKYEGLDIEDCEVDELVADMPNRKSRFTR
jgi:hypothetical protein